MPLDEFMSILGATVLEESDWRDAEPDDMFATCDHGGPTHSLVIPIKDHEGSICVECGEEF